MVGESVVAFELANAFMEKFGGDSLREITGKDFGTDLEAWDAWWTFFQKDVLAVAGRGGRTPGSTE